MNVKQDQNWLKNRRLTYKKQITPFLVNIMASCSCRFPITKKNFVEEDPINISIKFSSDWFQKDFMVSNYRRQCRRGMQSDDDTSHDHLPNVVTSTVIMNKVVVLLMHAVLLPGQILNSHF